MFDINTASTKWRRAKIGDAPSDRGYITKVTSDQSIGKKLVLVDGFPKKSRLKDSGRFIAKTVRCEDLEDLANVRKSLTSRQALIIGFVPGTEELCDFRIVTEKDLRLVTGTQKGEPRISAVQIDESGESHLCVGRFKVNFVHSRFLMFDHDVVKGLPEHLRVSSKKDWWKQMIDIDPLLARCSRVVVPSASNRVVIEATGKRAISSLACHVYVMVNDRHADLIPDYYVRLWAQAWNKGYGFCKDFKNSNGSITTRRYTIFDQSVSSSERLIYEGKPSVGPGLRCTR